MSFNDDKYKKELDNAAIEAENLIKKIEDPENPLTAYEALENEIQVFEKKRHRITELIPSGEAGPGFSLYDLKNSGKEFWNKYSPYIKKELCNPEGKLYSLYDQGLSESTRDIISIIMTNLGLPIAAIRIVAIIAAILVRKGLKSYCGWSNNTNALGVETTI